MSFFKAEEAQFMSRLKEIYEKQLRPIFGDQLSIDDSEEPQNCITLILDGEQEDFLFSLYGHDCVRLYWCNECFIFDKHRNQLVSSDTHGEIVFEHEFEVDQLPQMVVELIVHLKDCVYIDKKESIVGKTLWGYDSIKDYVVRAKINGSARPSYQLGNITIEYI